MQRESDSWRIETTVDATIVAMKVLLYQKGRKSTEKVLDVLLDGLLESEPTISLSPPTDNNNMGLWSDRQHSHLIFSEGSVLFSFHSLKGPSFLRHTQPGGESLPTGENK